jgi:4-hydroxybenzoate polyprenyltransferase
VVAAIALLAGAGLGTATRLGLSMTSLQFAIGALNDIVDAPADAGRIPPKPIPGGLIRERVAWAVVAVSAAVGLLLAVPSGLETVAVAVGVLVVGATYDLRAKGTAWSWLPFAIGIPLLPVYGWLGAAGPLPRFFAVLLPMAILAGAALAIANARVDLEVDRAAGTRSVATALGHRRSWLANAALLVVATVMGVVAADPRTWSLPQAALVSLGTLVVMAGILVGRGEGTIARRRAWEAQAVGAAIAGAGWVAGLLAGT